MKLSRNIFQILFSKKMPQTQIKKISFFLSSLRGGGAERVAINLAEDFIRRGYAVDFILVKKEGDLLAEVPAAVQLIALKSYSKKNLRTLFMLPALIRYLKQTQPVMLISSLPRNNIVITFATLFFNRRDLKIVVTEHSNVTESFKHKTTVKDKLTPFLLKLLYRRADHIIGVSQGVVDDLVQHIGLPANKIKVIYNPINVSKIQKLAAESIDASVMDEQHTNIISVGRFTEAKNYQLLITSFNALYQQQSDLRLIILGDGQLRQKLEAQIDQLGLKEVVSLPGFKKNPFAYMSKADLFVLSSSWEGFGNVLVEALACKLPIVSTDCPSGPAEILDNGRYGRLTKLGSMTEMRYAIQAALQEKITIDSSDRIAEFYPDVIAGQYLNLITYETER
jgi:glycosyltransferase involved in cell wall biosynthesis